MNELEFRYLGTLELRDARTVAGCVAPYYDGTPGTEYQLDANVFERFAPGCFDDWLKTDHPIELRYSHQKEQVLASVPKTLKVWSDKQGVMYEAKLNRTRAAEDALAMIQDGDIKGSSVGMYIQESRWVRENSKEIRLITRAALDEVSLVTRPAYKLATAALRERQDWHAAEFLEMYEKKIATLLDNINLPKSR